MMRGEGDNPTEDKYTVQGGVGGCNTLGCLTLLSLRYSGKGLTLLKFTTTVLSISLPTQTNPVFR